MLQSEVQTAVRSARHEALSEAVFQALTAGASPTDLMATISATITDYQASIQETTLGMLPCDDGEVIYDELPDGLIDLPTAAIDLGISRHTIHTWIRAGKLSKKGRLRGPAKGGGYLLLCKVELSQRLREPRNLGGRPKRTKRT